MIKQSLFSGKERRSIDKVKEFGTLIGADSTLVGTLKGKDNYAIYGRVEGDCDLEGALMLGPGGHWRGNISASIVFIAGQVEGNVVAREKLEITAGARVTGNISSASIAIADGAILEGEVRMLQKSQVAHFKDKRGNETKGDTPV